MALPNETLNRPSRPLLAFTGVVVEVVGWVLLVRDLSTTGFVLIMVGGLMLGIGVERHVSSGSGFRGIRKRVQDWDRRE
jgi:hypothetical protein